MIEGEDPASRFLPRIRQELDKLPLTREQKESVVPTLLKRAALLDSHGNTSSHALQAASSFFEFAAKLDGVVAHFQADGLTRADYLHAAVTQPQLFLKSPATIIENVQAVVDRFADDGLTRKAYLQAALKQPSLFTQSAETITGHITGVVEQFAADGLTLKGYLQAALRQPSLFHRSPEAVGGHVAGVVKSFAGDG